MAPPILVLTDIEGTTTPIAFVHRTLFPYARKALPGLLRDRVHEPDVAVAVAEIGRLAPGQDPLAQCLAWMDQDAKITPLKDAAGHRVGGRLRGWQPAGRDLSRRGARDARLAMRPGCALRSTRRVRKRPQRLIFGHTPDGDLRPLMSAFLDTRIGGKRETASYATAAATLQAPVDRMLFLSDVEAELDAAAGAGLLTCQLVLAGDGTVAGTRHPVESDFAGVARRFGLPSRMITLHTDWRIGAGCCTRQHRGTRQFSTACI